MARHKGINYLGKQSKEGICVAISIINALKWAGNKTITGAHIPYVYRQAGNPGEGTMVSKVLAVLRNRCKKYLKVQYRMHLKGRELLTWLESGNAAILDYFITDEKGSEIGHSVFLLNDGDSILFFNDFGKGLSRVNKKRFVKEFFKQTEFYPGAYLLRKTNGS